MLPLSSVSLPQVGRCRDAVTMTFTCEAQFTPFGGRERPKKLVKRQHHLRVRREGRIRLKDALEHLRLVKGDNREVHQSVSRAQVLDIDERHLSRRHDNQVLRFAVEQDQLVAA